jgi:hypothetical protein
MLTPYPDCALVVGVSLVVALSLVGAEPAVVTAGAVPADVPPDDPPPLPHAAAAASKPMHMMPDTNLLDVGRMPIPLDLPQVADSASAANAEQLD